MAKRSKKTEIVQRPEPSHGDFLTGISSLLGQGRRMTARSVNSILPRLRGLSRSWPAAGGFEFRDEGRMLG